MKSKKLIFILYFFIFLNGTCLNSKEEFNFEVTEIEILNEGNFFRGLKRGNAKTIDESVNIIADTFEYDKIKNILTAQGSVILKDKIKNYLIETDHISYFKDSEIVFSKGKTRIFFENKYEAISRDIKLDKTANIISSKNKTIIFDDSYNEYETDLFSYSIDKNTFKGKNIIITTNYNKTETEKEFYKFENGIFDLENKEFVASDAKIFLKKDSFDIIDNDPRIFGNSAKKKGNITKLKKAIFTSCKQSDDCPPWSIKASEITHDQDKNDITYKNPILRIYDFPIVYFPKFTHPDPTVKRRSGFLQPRLNSSNVLGSSIFLPYFHIISDNKDITFKPTFFDNSLFMLQNEYRQKNESSELIANFGITNGYKLSNDSDNNITNLFAKFKSKLNLNNFVNSELKLSIQKVTKDTFLKVFDTNLIDMNKNIKPINQNKLQSDINLNLINENYNFDTGLIAYENLNGLNSDRYQLVLPYYNFSSTFYNNNFFNIEFLSNGNNDFSETNKLKSIINNDFILNSKDYFSNIGFKNNFNIYFKNLNSVAKNTDNFKSSPEIELMSLINFETSLPLIKLNEDFTNIFTPKASLRINPGDMKDLSSETRNINTDNIFSINRLGLSDTLESGKSLTLGFNYKMESTADINKYFDLNLAGVLRDESEKNFPGSNSLDQTSSNLFGSTSYNLSEFINLNYDFSIDNDFKKFEQNSLGLDLKFDNITTNFNFSEYTGKLGSTNYLENSTSIKFNEENSLNFNTRRNRKINFTEYYDLVYKYKNDCLVAGIKYKKSYYQDRDLKPTEDFLLTITFFPLTQYEQKIDESLYQ